MNEHVQELQTFFEPSRVSVQRTQLDGDSFNSSHRFPETRCGSKTILSGYLYRSAEGVRYYCSLCSPGNIIEIWVWVNRG